MEGTAFGGIYPEMGQVSSRAVIPSDSPFIEAWNLQNPIHPFIKNRLLRPSGLRSGLPITALPRWIRVAI